MMRRKGVVGEAVVHTYEKGCVGEKSGASRPFAFRNDLFQAPLAENENTTRLG